jgi:molecular chaperone GrpE
MEEGEVEKLKAERDEYLAGWKRAKADLLNYKKEEAEQRQQWLWSVGAEHALAMLPVLDSLDRAGHMLKGDTGFENIVRQVQDILGRQGLQELKVLGEPFDPACHESIEEIDGSSGTKISGTVAQVVEKGYVFNNRLLRPAKVKIVK